MPVATDWELQFGPDAGLAQIAEAEFLDEKPTRAAVAVSGGSDSMAMLHVMAAVARHQGIALYAVTVDHGLRAEAVAEAEVVAQACAGLGVAHQVLRWNHGAVAGNLMDAARRARYGLMADWATTQDISHIYLGHTADDQAETFLMELARSAGIDGLVGMQSGWRQGGVQFMRPLLAVQRADLRGYLERQGVGWVEDPSNENDRFLRVKTRQALKVLQPLGITVGTLSHVMTNLAAARAAVLVAVGDAAVKLCFERAGEVEFDLTEWLLSAPEVRRRLLIAALRWISGAGYVPRGSGVGRVLLAIERGCDATFAGCRIRMSARGFRVVREPKAVTGLVCARGSLWDGRWCVDGPFAAGQEVRALGADGLRQCKGWKTTGYSKDSLLVSPAVWYNGVLMAAPLAGFEAGFSARIVAPFNEFVLSH